MVALESIHEVARRKSHFCQRSSGGANINRGNMHLAVEVARAAMIASVSKTHPPQVPPPTACKRSPEPGVVGQVGVRR